MRMRRVLPWMAAFGGLLLLMGAGGEEPEEMPEEPTGPELEALYLGDLEVAEQEEGEAPPPPLPEEDPRKAARKKLQNALYALGYRKTNRDGESSPNYVKALRAFQTDVLAAENIFVGIPATFALLEEHGRMEVDGLGGPQVWDWVVWARANQSTFSAAIMNATGHQPGGKYP
jgi:hypothetical protein